MEEISMGEVLGWGPKWGPFFDIPEAAKKRNGTPNGGQKCTQKCKKVGPKMGPHPEPSGSEKEVDQRPSAPRIQVHGEGLGMGKPLPRRVGKVGVGREVDMRTALRV